MRRPLARLLLVLLLGGVVGGGALAWANEVRARRVGSGPSLDAPAPLTPVLSVRRAPAVLVGPLGDRRLQEDLAAVATFLPPASCLVVAGPDQRVEHRGDAALVPASTQKLLVAATAWEVLGPDHRFRTAALAAAPLDEGVLRGDLVLVGGGDPLLATDDYVARFRRQPQAFTDLGDLAEALVAAGLRRVDGAVVGDEGHYDRQRYVAGWPDRYREQNAVGPLSALSVNDGFARYPTPDDPSAALVPADDPARQAAARLTDALEARGVAVGRPPRSGSAPPGEVVELAALESPPLEAVLAQLLLESDNSTAELLVKELGRAAGDGPTTAAGASVVAEVVGGDPTVRDGSGLSLDDRVTCDLLVDLLGRPGTGGVLVDALPLAGRSGTLDRRFDGTALEGVLRAKTGSLNTVSALAGVVDDGDPPLRFALVVNVEAPDRIPDFVAGLQRAVGEVLVGWPRVPGLAAVGPLAQDG